MNLTAASFHALQRSGACKLLSAAVLLLGLLASSATPPLAGDNNERAGSGAAVIKGTVRSPEGAPLYGILVRARGEGKNYTTSVFTDEKGQYDFPPLSIGAYQVFVGSSRHEVALVFLGVTQDFTVQLGSDLMNQTTGANWFRAIPGGEADKRLIARNCANCHSEWRLIQRTPASPESWAEIVERMLNKQKELGKFGAYQLTVGPEEENAMIQFLAKNVTSDTKKTYAAKALERPTGEAARAVFTEWDLPRGTLSAATVWTDPTGNIWYTPTGANALGRVDPTTGEIQEWPYAASDAIYHDVIGDKAGNLWITAASLNKILKFDPHTEKFTTWEIPLSKGKFPHTGDFDPDGKYWITLALGEDSGIAKLDLPTGNVTKFELSTKYATAYGLAVDRTGVVWFSELDANKVGKIDLSGKLTEYSLPVPDSGPRRLQLDSKGRVWFTESYVSRIAMLDPKNGKISEYDPGVPNGHPYFIKVDKFDNIWFDSVQGNQLGKFDPETKKFVNYLMPTPDSFSRDASFHYNSDGSYAIDYGSVDQPLIGRMYVRKERQ